MKRALTTSLAAAVMVMSVGVSGQAQGPGQGAGHGVALALLTGAMSQAQPTAPGPTTRSQVTLVRVKPDMLNEWLDLQKNEQIPAQKKGGVTTRTTLQTAIGNGFEFAIITPFPSFGALDEQNPVQKALGTEAAARLAAKIRKCIDTQRNYLITRADDLRIPEGDAVAMRTSVVHVAAGKQGDYLNYIRTEVLPAMKKAKAAGKIAGYNVSTRGIGSQAGEITTTTYYSKFADIEQGSPVVQVLGQAAADAITAKGNALASPVQVIIRRRVADLRF